MRGSGGRREWAGHVRLYKANKGKKRRNRRKGAGPAYIG
jgi:hypothetical protein